MVKVERRGNESFYRLLKRFQKKVRRSKIITIYKNNQTFKKESTKRKEARKDREHKRRKNK